MPQNPEWYRTPSQILSDLGIQEPSDIDIEAIAEDCDATIRYRSLSGCTARIMGFNNRAIITIVGLADKLPRIGVGTEVIETDANTNENRRST